MTGPTRSPTPLMVDNDNMTDDEVPSRFPVTLEIGRTGLRRAGGYIDEEFLPALRGPKAMQIYREMSDNDPIVGALLFAVTQLLREINWHTEPASSKAKHRADSEFVDSCREDMSHTWADLMVEIASMLPFGFSWHEVVYKRRIGPWERDPKRRSQFTDGRIGWRKMPIRSQESLLRWVFEEDSVKAIVTMPAPDYQMRTIPLAKSLLFRTSLAKGNPEGRALDPDTPIPTPDGWRRMGELHPGARVFDETGAVRHVTARADWADRPRYRVTFADGSEIVADANHQWVVTAVGRRDTPLLRTTEQLARRPHRLYAVNRTLPVDYVAQRLLVDPYVFGVWLGDGDSNGARVTCHVDDLADQVAAIEARGYEVTKLGQNGVDGGLGRYFRIGSGLQADLRRLGVIGNKHIPAEYLQGSVEQRRALLAGLFDTDGHCDKFGRVEFVSINRGVIDDVTTLLHSLGMDARASLRRHAGIDSRGLSRSTTWAVRFTPTEDMFALARKNLPIKSVKARGLHYIRTIEPIEPGDTVCIEVDAPSHLFLAGESYVPTHNSILRNSYRPWFMKKRMEDFESVGVERDLAGLPVGWVPARVLDAKPGTKDAQMRDAWAKMVKSVRRDTQDGLVLPLAYDDSGNKLFDFSLLTSGGSRQFDTSGIIARYEQRILMTTLADFILVGHESVGSYNMHADKSGLFKTAINAYAQSIAEVFNRHAIPKLFALNGMRPDELPKLVPDEVDPPDLAQLMAFMTGAAGLGVQWFPDPKLEEFLRSAARLPKMDREQEALAETQQRQAAIISLAQQRLQALQIGQQAQQGELALQTQAATTTQATQATQAGPPVSGKPAPGKPASGKPASPARPSPSGGRRQGGTNAPGRTS